MIGIFPKELKDTTAEEIPKNISENSTVYYCVIKGKFHIFPNFH